MRGWNTRSYVRTYIHTTQLETDFGYCWHREPIQNMSLLASLAATTETPRSDGLTLCYRDSQVRWLNHCTTETPRSDGLTLCYRDSQIRWPNHCTTETPRSDGQTTVLLRRPGLMAKPLYYGDSQVRWSNHYTTETPRSDGLITVLPRLPGPMA